jgi:ABC-2 type transport system permease protein
MAETHLEVYRRFKGRLSAGRMRFWPILAANVHVAAKKKLPLLLLYAVPAIATVVLSFIVYGKYAAETQLGELRGGGLAGLMLNQAQKQLETRNLIAQFLSGFQYFALLPAAWYGAGLLAEDRRVGAHLLYFARPITRLDYFLGKFLTAALYTALAVMLPGIVICTVAAFVSEEWAFLKEEGDVIPAHLAASGLWVAFTSVLALAASAIAPRKIFALAGFLGFFMITQAVGGVLGSIQDHSLFSVAPLLCLNRIAEELYEVPHRIFDFPLRSAWTTVGLLFVVAIGLIAWRLRRLEVVA